MQTSPNYRGFKLTYGDATGKQLAVLVPASYRVLHFASAADEATDWAVANPTHPTFYVHSETTPATDYMSLSHDGTTGLISVAGGTLSLNGVTSLGLQVGGTTEITLTATTFSPTTNDGQALGTTSLGWGDLFLASGAVINFLNGEATLTHQAGNTQGKLKFDVSLANAAMDDGYGVLEVNANLTGTTTSWVAASSAWVNINTATAGAGVMVASVNNGIYEAAGGTVTNAYLAYGGRYQAILGDADASRLTVFSLNVSGDTATSIFQTDSTDGKEIGLVATRSAAASTHSVPFIMTASGTILYAQLWAAAS